MILERTARVESLMTLEQGGGVHRRGVFLIDGERREFILTAEGFAEARAAYVAGQPLVFIVKAESAE